MRFEHLYVHAPFCARRCVYCDFSIAVRSAVPSKAFADAIASELEIRHNENALDLETVYLGGGTPSKLGGGGVAALLESLRRRAHIRKDAEITIEANPEDVSAAAVRDWMSAGVNRVSLGVQSFDDGVLAWMHRTHDAAAARAAVHVLREGGLSNLSIDLIFALPETLGRSWQQDLDRALALDLPHLSLYGLTVEPRTPLGRSVTRRKTDEASEERYEEEFLLADAALTAAGYDHYEVSNYGRPGAHSRHNWAYWRRKPYVGVGPSAHEFDGRSRRWNEAAYTAWLSQVSVGKDPTVGSELLSSEQEEDESLYLGLRTSTGVSIRPSDQARFGRWVEAGWGTLAADSRLRLTARGWLRVDSVSSDLTAFRSRY